MSGVPIVTVRSGATALGGEVVELVIGGITFRRRVADANEGLMIAMEVHAFLEKAGVEFEEAEDA